MTNEQIVEIAYALRSLVVMVDSTDFRSCESARTFKEAYHYWTQRNRTGIDFAAKALETA